LNPSQMDVALQRILHFVCFVVVRHTQSDHVVPGMPINARWPKGRKNSTPKNLRLLFLAGSSNKFNVRAVVEQAKISNVSALPQRVVPFSFPVILSRRDSHKVSFSHEEGCSKKGPAKLRSLDQR